MPYVYAGIKFETPINLSGLKQETLLYLFENYLQDKISEEFNQAFDAGFRVDFDVG